MKNSSYLLGLLFIANIYSCANTTAEQKPIVPAKMETESMQTATTGFIHTVFFWMKEGFDEEKKLRFEAGLEKLSKVPSIQSVYWGPPAGTDRTVVDNSYDYAWIVHFANANDQDAYQVDPIHVKFVDECKDIWDRVQVYDTVVNN